MKRALFSIIICAAILSACATARWVSTPVLNQKDAKVSLESLQEKGNTVNQHFNHPFTINPGEAERLFNNLMYVERTGIVVDLFKNQKQKAIFQPEESAKLAPAISEALAKADPNQRVRFQSLNRGGGIIFPSRRITQGIIFIDSSNLFNIVFNVVNYELSADEPDEVPSDFKNRDPYQIKGSWTALVPTASYAHLQQLDNGKDNPMWLVVDLNKFNLASKEKTAPVPTQEAKTLPTASEETQPPGIQQTIESPADRNENIKNRLQLLKQLFDEGLITDKEYDAKKKEILEEIK